MSQTFYAVDNSAILYLSLIKPHHTNVYRFTMTLTEPVNPKTLQTALNHITPRFPTIIAGFRPGFFGYTMVPAQQPPVVQPDPGLLHTMRMEEITCCAYRVYYRGNQISFEAFHALTDGYGAVASFTTLVAEYLRLAHGISIPVENTLREISQLPLESELEDAYELHQAGEPLHLPSRYSYQLPRQEQSDWQVQTCARTYPTAEVLAAARRLGVSATGMLSGLMASTIMELQQRQNAKAKLPVRVMVPVDLRRMFASTTLRNFILYALPTLEPRDEKKPLTEVLRSFHSQIQQQVEPKRMAAIMAYNVRTQSAPWFRAIPRAVKCFAMRTAYRFFGESNSSITLTNLGGVRLPEAMAPYVTGLEVILTPRAGSPYNCAVISLGERMTVNLSRFGNDHALEELFFGKLESALRGEI